MTEMSDFEFVVYHVPFCGKRVKQGDNVLGFCTRARGHSVNVRCTHIFNEAGDGDVVFTLHHARLSNERTKHVYVDSVADVPFASRGNSYWY